MTRARDVANIDGILTTTGDTFYASAAATPARLGVGSTGQVLTVASGVPSWATPTAGSYTQLATGSLTGSSVSITSISGSYKNLVIYLDNISLSAQNEVRFTLNSVTGAIYGYTQINNAITTSAGTTGTTYGAVGTFPSYQDSTSAVLNFPFYYTNRRPSWVINTGSYPSNGSPMAYLQFGALNQAGPVTSIQLFPSAGTFSTGTYTVYGVN